jgi:predicted SAM-dependent methyltransferase
MEPIYLHLGCGKRRLPHPPWVNIDIDGKIHTEGYSDEYGDAIYLIQYADNSINAIYASHLLDHLSRNKKVDEALSEWYRVLEPGGILRVAVSDFEMVVKMYSEGLDLERLWGHIVGGHKTSFDKHGCVFDFNLLKRYLEKHGFTDIKRYRWQEFLPEGFDDLSQAYIPHMNKEKGILMSLNVRCKK